jgi:hypothetical protein
MSPRIGTSLVGSDHLLELVGVSTAELSNLRNHQKQVNVPIPGGFVFMGDLVTFFPAL